MPIPSITEKTLHDLPSHTSRAGLPPPVGPTEGRVSVARPLVESKCELEAVLSATTFNKQTRAVLGAHTEHLRESVT